MSYNYSNKTLFEIKSDVGRYVYGGWLSFVVLCSLLGDITILIASIKYNAIKLHKMIVAFIQHIAICDLLCALCILPTVLYIIDESSSYIFEYTWFFMKYYSVCVSASLIAAMALGKLLTLKYPLRAASWSKRQAHMICATIWAILPCIPAMHLLVDKTDMIFDYRVYNYAYMYSSSIWRPLLPLLALIALFAPNCTIIISTVLLLKEARKVVIGTTECLRWQGIMTVVLSATVYSVSYLPIVAYFLAEPFVEKDPSVPGPFYTEFYTIATSVGYINVLANFFLYSLTVRSFRSFLKTKIQLKCPLLFNTTRRGKII